MCNTLPGLAKCLEHTNSSQALTAARVSTQCLEKVGLCFSRALCDLGREVVVYPAQCYTLKMT